MALTDTTIRQAKPASRDYKIFDGGGLFLLVRPSGGKLWRFRYRHLGKEQLISLGAYPDVTLKDARAARDKARREIGQGKNPSFERKRPTVAAKVSAVNTFAAIAEELIVKREREGAAEATTVKSRWLLKHLEPALGARPIAEIEPFELLAVVKRIEGTGKYETARRLLEFAGRVMRYAVATARAQRNIAADLQGSLTAPKVKHHAAIIDPAGVGALLRAIDGFEGHPATKWALRLAPLVFVRPGELRKAEWCEIDLDAGVWRIPGHRMKMKREHAVPLSTQAVAILREA